MKIQMQMRWNGGREHKMRHSHDDEFLGDLAHSLFVLLAQVGDGSFVYCFGELL